MEYRPPQKAFYRPPWDVRPRSIFHHVQDGIEGNWTGEKLEILRDQAKCSFGMVMQRDAMKMTQTLGLWRAMYADL